MHSSTLIIACGALAKELVELRRRNQWEFVNIKCLPAEWHNTPERIPEGVEEIIQKYRQAFEHMFVAYADCGTGGRLDQMLAKYGVDRIPGAHCYEFYAGSSVFSQFTDEEPGSFYLTDFLAQHFERLVIETLGLDRHPELKGEYFGNYRRLVYLAQTRSDSLSESARKHAEYLGLEYVEYFTGLDSVEIPLQEHIVQWQN